MTTQVFLFFFNAFSGKNLHLNAAEYTSPMLGILQWTEGGINVMKHPNFEFKN